MLTTVNNTPEPPATMRPPRARCFPRKGSRNYQDKSQRPHREYPIQQREYGHDRSMSSKINCEFVIPGSPWSRQLLARVAERDPSYRTNDWQLSIEGIFVANRRLPAASTNPDDRRRNRRTCRGASDHIQFW